MAKYNDSFSLNTKDIDLIEEGLRSLWDVESEQHSLAKPTPIKIRKIHNLLGKLNSQKIHYSEVNPTDCPIG